MVDTEVSVPRRAPGSGAHPWEVRPGRVPPKQQWYWFTVGLGVLKLGNDPSAGSPTETLLRLLLPLNDRVWRAFRPGVVVAHLSGPVRTPH